MAIHYSISSMLQESLAEMVLVAEYCLNYQKDPKVWGSSGCFGWPAAILLLAIADSIGSYVIGGKTRKHFDILNHPDFYNLKLNENNIDVIYEDYRCLLTHNAALPAGALMDIGAKDSPVFETFDKNTRINLYPLLLLTKQVVSNFLSNVKPSGFNAKILKKIFS